MYADPTKIRAHEVKIRIDDHERDLIEAIVQYNGGQKAVIVRELLLEQVRLMIRSNPNVAQG